MKKSNLPKCDSIQELAEFWDTHDITDFDDELEEVVEPVFIRRKAVEIKLMPSEAKAVQRLAKAKGISSEELIRTWVLHEIVSSRNGRRNKRRGR
ncbi:MAG TPA: CopG family antitoxin [Gemmataceae bacterium]|nr:CopG family antitoxin [Gemmataceae bacterium]